MHEMSLVGSLHDIVNDAASRSAFTRVRRLHLSLGRLSCVDPDTLRWCITTTSAGTCLEHAELIITIEAALAHCEHCEQDYEPDTLMTPCPHCGHNAQKILHGRDLRITALDVEPVAAPEPTLTAALSMPPAR